MVRATPLNVVVENTTLFFTPQAPTQPTLPTKTSPHENPQLRVYTAAVIHQPELLRSTIPNTEGCVEYNDLFINAITTGLNHCLPVVSDWLQKMPDRYQMMTSAPPSYSLSMSADKIDEAETDPLLLNEYFRRDSPRYYKDIHAVTILSKEPHTVPPPSPVEWRPTLNKERKELSTNWCGVLLAFLSGTFFTLSSAALKALKSVDPMELLMIRSALQVAVMLAVAYRGGHNVVGPRGYRLLLQLQGIVGGITLVLLFYSFRRLPLGDATTIIFSSPMFVMLLSLIFLREPCGFFRTTVVCLLLAGVILISKPPFIFQFFVHESQTHQHYDVVGYACAVTATLFTAFNMVVMRKCKDIHFSVVVLQLSSWSLLVASVLLGILGHHHGEIIVPPRGLLQWGLAVIVSVFGLSGQVLVARALSMEGAGRVAVTRSLDIILAFLLQVFIFGEIPDWLSVLGAFFVLVCVIGMGLEEHIHYLASLVP
uniref:EamA domain-containing protein n=1 Tax=Timema shepardi TaxID=629360 RepID=A0A7R9ATV9_TIMSH|nr:unnamed protein product [Timema shepardi]